MTPNENILYYVNDNNIDGINDFTNRNEEDKKNNEFDLDALYNEYGIHSHSHSHSHPYSNSHNYTHTYDDYMTNYTVKQLTHILNYYKLNIGRLRKNEMVQLIILFENEDENNLIVNQRQQKWFYINELKKDNYFNKFILF